MATNKKTATKRSIAEVDNVDENPSKKQKKENEKKEVVPLLVVPTDFTKPELKPNNIKIVSWNVASWSTIQGKGFPLYVTSENPDIICVQETKVDEKRFKSDVLAGYEAYFYSCKTNPGYAGTALFTKIKPLTVTKGIGIEDHDDEGRCITAEFDNFYLVNTYIPNAGLKLKDLPYREKWDEAFLTYLKELDAKKPVVWCGDLNVAHKEIDIKNPKGNKKNAGFSVNERANFGKVLEAGFVDTYRHLNPDQKDCYTFWSFKFNSRAKDVGWRLDYFVVSKALVPRVTESYIRKHIMGSDHCPVVLHLEK
jgi:exodeoxyribonuclease III